MDSPSEWRLSSRAKYSILVVVAILAVAFILQIRGILAPFLWALVAAYLFAPVVNYLNERGQLPRLAAVLLIYAAFALLLLAGSRYLYPRLVDEGTVFLEDIPRLAGTVIALVGPRPLGIDIASLVQELTRSATGYSGNPSSAGHLIAQAAQTVVKIFLFLVTTFYLLMDSRRVKASLRSVIPSQHRPELLALASQINLTWQQYIRGELVLFGIMAIGTTVGLTVLRVPGALFLGLVSGALELLPFVGPLTAGLLAVSVAYISGTNPWGWSPIIYAAVVAAMYFVFREAEDYFVVPHVLGRAVRLHPLVVLFSVTAGGIIAGLLGLLIAVPVAASIKAIFTYLYAKMLDQPVEFAPIQTIGGGIIEIPVHAARISSTESGSSEGTGASQR